MTSDIEQVRMTVYKQLKVAADAVFSDSSGALWMRVRTNCPRCHGSGFWGRGRGPRSRCFRCNGEGTLANSERVFTVDDLGASAQELQR